MNTHIIDVLDKIVLALFKTRDFLSKAMLQAAVDHHPAQQSPRVSFAFPAVRPERFDFRVLDIAAQNISQSDDVGPRELVLTIALSIMRVDAQGMCPGRAFFAEWGEQRELELVACSRM